MPKFIAVLTLGALALGAVPAISAPTVADKCEASKNKVAGAYYSCREKAEATAISKGISPDYGKCTAKFDDKWDTAEAKGATMCPDNVLTPAINAFIASQAAQTALIVAGSEGVPVCGDSAVNAVGEHCDGADLGGTDCSSLFLGIGSLACNGSCKFDASDCEPCPPGTVALNGACWLMGAVQGLPDVGDCDDACASVGLACDEAALQAVGSGGTDADCRDALDVVAPGGAPYPISDASPDDRTSCGTVADYASGCSLVGGFGGGNDGAVRVLHTGGATVCSADATGGICGPAGTQQRICACTF